MKFLSLTVNGFDVKVAFDENSVHVYNAYPIKDDLKLRGYRWNSAEKVWFNDKNDVENELIVLKNNLKPDSIEEKQEVNPEVFEKDNEKSGLPESNSVAELKSRLQRIISQSLGGNIWVRGIISSELKNYKWASYFDFRDEDEGQDVFFSAELKASVLSSINYKLKKSGVADSLSKDLPVLLLVNIGLSYKKNVNIKLNIIDILPEFTREKLKNQREITLDRLKTDGILENQKQFTLPMLTRKIGLISSEQGTSVQDILAGMGKYKDKYDVFFIDARMEGDNAVSSIIKGVEYFEKHKIVDVILIARGGGSEQSLSLFNDYKLCKKICNSKRPVITAIGHEKDLSAIELCSFLTPTPSTPSGIGKFFFDKYFQTEKELFSLFNGISNLSNSLLKDHLFTVHQKINSISIINKRLIADNYNKISDRISYVFLRVNSKIKLEMQNINFMSKKIEPKRLYNAVLDKKNDVIRYTKTIFDNGARLLKNSDNNLKQIKSIINANAPDKILKRGFSLTLNQEGHVITSKEKFTDNKAVLRFFDGEVKIKKNEDENG